MNTFMAKPRLAVIDYGMGNLRSVLNAWRHVGADAVLVDNTEQVTGFDALVFPGQGAIIDTMRMLQQSGFDNFIRDWIERDRPFFGICLGLQGLFEHSEEGDTKCLGIFPGEVLRFPSGSDARGQPVKIPHMGWNEVQFQKDLPCNDGLDPLNDQFYFVHSYYASTSEVNLIWGITEYAGVRFVSALSRGNCVATQCHPEKSQAKGLQLYRNFLRQL